MANQRIKANLIPSCDMINPFIHLAQYDVSDGTGKQVEIELYYGADKYTIPSGSTVTFRGTKRDKTGYSYEITKFTDNVVTVDVKPQMTALSGTHNAELRITNGHTISNTIKFIMDIESSALADDTKVSETQLPTIEKASQAYDLLVSVQDKVEEAKVSAESAIQTKAEIEQLKKDTVEQTKTLTDSAKQEISTTKDATVSEVTQLKTDTISEITSIKDRAVEEVTVIKSDATAEADRATEANTEAKAQAERASSFAANASASADTATSASASASASAQSASNASISASESARNASESASSSAQSATNASQSATNAQESASSASTSADTATSKATEASTSATKAKESETNAKLSETNASNSAKEAKESADSVANIVTDVSQLKEDLSNKITKFYASNQGETHLADSDNGKIQDMMIYGKSEQKQYSGKNLLELSDNQVQIENLKIQINQGIITFSGTVNNESFIMEIDSFTVPSDGTYAISTNSNSNKESPRILITINDSPYSSAFNGATKELNAGDVVRLYIRISSVGSYDGVTIKPMIEKGSKVTSYEPYTGGIPSPSLDYPQEIKSVVNPTVKLLGSNILKIADGEYQDGGVTATVSNGVVKLKGTANRYLDIQLTANDENFFKEGTEIIFSPNNIKGIENLNGAYLDFTNNNTIGFSLSNKNTNTPYIIKKNDTKYSFVLFIRCNKGKTYDLTWMPQVLIGKVITPFKPYTEQTITLPVTLNAIPVKSGGNVTINGQQYVADRVVEKDGVFGIERNIREIHTNTKTMNNSEMYPGWNKVEGISDTIYYNESPIAESHKLFYACNFTKTSIFQNNNKNNILYFIQNNIGYSQSELIAKAIDVDMYIRLQDAIFEPLPVDIQVKLQTLVTNYPVTNISVTSDQLDGYTVFNYPISMANGWNYVKQQLNDNRDYIYDMDLQSAEAYVNSEYAVTLTELEV